MLQEIIVPKLGTNIEEGRIVEWRKREGDPVKKGEALLLVETSKAIFEVESEFNGFLRKVFSGVGVHVTLTEPVALISDGPDEDIRPYLQKERREAGKKRHHEIKREELVKGAVEAAPSPPQNARAERVPATPAARRLMAEYNVSPEKVSEAFGGQTIDEAAVRRFLGKKRLAVYGGGLGAKQVRELLRFYEGVSVAGIIDDNPAVKGREILGLSVLGGWREFAALVSKGLIDAVAVSLHSEVRRKIIERIKSETPEVELMALVDRRAIVSAGVAVSPGALVEAGAVIGPDTFIGEGAIIDTGAVVSHDCHIGAHSHLSPGCSISGIVKLEGNVLVGVGACVNSQVSVGMNSVITPGSAVVSDVPPDVVVSGNPARIIGKSRRGE